MLEAAFLELLSPARGGGEGGEGGIGEGGEAGEDVGWLASGGGEGGDGGASGGKAGESAGSPASGGGDGGIVEGGKAGEIGGLLASGGRDVAWDGDAWETKGRQSRENVGKEVGDWGGHSEGGAALGEVEVGRDGMRGEGDGGMQHLLTVHEFDEWGNPNEDEMVLEMMRKLCPYHTLIMGGSGGSQDALLGVKGCVESSPEGVRSLHGVENNSADVDGEGNTVVSKRERVERVPSFYSGGPDRPQEERMYNGKGSITQALKVTEPAVTGAEGMGKQHFPAVYLTAGLRDARVPFWMPVKYAAAARHALKGVEGGSTVLLHFSGDAGHFSQGLMGGDVREAAEQLAFLLTSMKKRGE